MTWRFLAILSLLASNPWDDGLDAWVEGDSAKAVAAEDACAAKGVEKCKTLAAAMRNFIHLSGAPDDGDVSTLRRLVELEFEITGTSHPRRPSQRKLVPHLCRTAALAKARGDFREAFLQARRALELDETSSCALEVMGDVYRHLAPDAGSERMGDFPPYKAPLIH